MQLEHLLLQKKDIVLKKWFDHVIHTYPEETSKIFGRQKDLFANPVGGRIYLGLESVLGELLQGMSRDRLKSLLDPIVRIRAVQAFLPSESISFLFHLKAIIREVIAKEEIGTDITDALFALDSKIDTLGLIGFDIYMECREKMSEIKTNEMRRTAFNALARANLLKDEPEG
jgi:hypothetical protein